MYFDDIKAVNTANIDYSKPGEDIKPGEDVKPGGDIKPGDGSTGITPDITVEIPQEILEKDYDRNIDPQFKKALEVIRDKN